MAGASTGPTHAQLPEEALVYEKWLDLRLNPTHAAPPPPVGGVGGGLRVVHGRESQRGAWPSVVNISVVKDGIGRSTCGGTLIGRRWVLTAAHCAFRTHEGGVSLVTAATVYAGSHLRFDPGSTLPYEGEALRVRRVVVHPDFARSPGLLNDVALLELEKDTTVERQKLTAPAGAPAFLAPGNPATVVGWGVTAPVPVGASPAKEPLRFPHSSRLIEGTLPVASTQACAAFLKRPVSPVEFCAGNGTASADSCNGDSGGPLLVRTAAGEVVQAGVVSWGPGCAQPDTYGVYASVAHFDGWIGKYVPDAQFVAPQDTAPALAAIAGGAPGRPPALPGRVAVDLMVVGCTKASLAAPQPAAAAPPETPGRFKVGTCVRVRATSSFNGHLVVFSRNAGGEVVQLFPNRVSGGKPDGALPTRVQARQVVAVPGPADDFDLKVTGPLGRAELIAVVVPDAVDLPATVKPYRGPLRSVVDFERELADIARDLAGVPLAPRAVGTRQYDVVE